MKHKNLILLAAILLAVNLNLSAWTSSNEGVCYTMDTTFSFQIAENNKSLILNIFDIHEYLVKQISISGKKTSYGMVLVILGKRSWKEFIYTISVTTIVFLLLKS